MLYSADLQKQAMELIIESSYGPAARCVDQLFMGVKSEVHNKFLCFHLGLYPCTAPAGDLTENNFPLEDFNLLQRC